MMTAHHVGNLAPSEPAAVMQAENPDGSLLHFILGVAAVIFFENFNVSKSKSRSTNE